MHEMIYTEILFQMRAGDTKKKEPLFFFSKNNKGNKNHLDIRLEKPINLTTYSPLGLLFLLHHSPRVTNCIFCIGNFLEYFFVTIDSLHNV